MLQGQCAGALARVPPPVAGDRGGNPRPRAPRDNLPACQLGFQRMTADRIRWRWLLPSAAIAVLLLAIGVVLQGWSAATAADVVLAISSGALLLVVGVIVEPRLTRRIGETTREVLRGETEPLVQRILSLEELAGEQVRQRQDIREDIAEITGALRSGPTRQSVVDALQKADELNLFDRHFFRVRTTTDIEGPELFLFSFETTGHSELLLSFSPILYGSSDPTQWNPLGFPPDENPVGILWRKEQSTIDILLTLEKKLLASDLEFRSEFDFPHGLEMLAESLATTFAVRTSGSSSSVRLVGELVCLINDEWFMTTHGLESLRADSRYPFEKDVPDSSSCPAQHSRDRWDEAIAYLQARREEVERLMEARYAYGIANS